MKPRIGKHEDVAEALLRILRDDFDAAQRDFRGAGRREERIHRVRQRLKHARTVLRVLEPAFGKRAETLRHTLSSAARLLARARDADVAAASARNFARASAHGDALGFSRVAESLSRDAAEAHKQRTPVGEITMLFASAGAALSRLRPNFDGEALLADALKRAYRRGREAGNKAEATLSAADLHTWRKRVKELSHLLRLARKRLPGSARQARRRLDRLDGLLGTDNDHALLAEKLALLPTADLSLMDQLAAIARRRSRLEARAFAIGRKVYARKPKRFARKAALA